MKICKYRQKGIAGTSCSLGISPMRCGGCPSFSYPTAQDRHSADVGVVAVPQRMSEKENVPVDASRTLESEILTRGPVQGGCGCKKKQNG